MVRRALILDVSTIPVPVYTAASDRPGGGNAGQSRSLARRQTRVLRCLDACREREAGGQQSYLCAGDRRATRRSIRPDGAISGEVGGFGDTNDRSGRNGDARVIRLGAAFADASVGIRLLSLRTDR